MTPDREDMEPAEDGGMDTTLDDKMVVAFPHEHHYALAQEFLRVFGGASEVTLIDLTVQSGAALFGVILCNGRAAIRARTRPLLLLLLGLGLLLLERRGKAC